MSRIELDRIDLCPDRHPAAGIARCRIGRAQQRQRQTSVLQGDALHRGRHIRCAQEEAFDHLAATTDFDLDFLTREHHRARSRQHVAQRQIHGAADFKDRSLEVQRQARRIRRRLDHHRGLAPVHHAGVGRARSAQAQPDIELQTQIRTAQTQAQGLGAQHRQAIGLGLEREPTAPVVRIQRCGQGHAQRQALELQAQGGCVAAGGQARVDAGAANHQHPALNRLGHAALLLLSHIHGGLEQQSVGGRQHLQHLDIAARQRAGKAHIEVGARLLAQEEAGRLGQRYAQLKRPSHAALLGGELDEGPLDHGTDRGALVRIKARFEFACQVVRQLVGTGRATQAIACRGKVIVLQDINHILIGHAGEHHLVADRVLAAEQQQFTLGHCRAGRAGRVRQALQTCGRAGFAQVERKCTGAANGSRPQRDDVGIASGIDLAAGRAIDQGPQLGSHVVAHLLVQGRTGLALGTQLQILGRHGVRQCFGRQARHGEGVARTPSALQFKGLSLRLRAVHALDRDRAGLPQFLHLQHKRAGGRLGFENQQRTRARSLGFGLTLAIDQAAQLAGHVAQNLGVAGAHSRALAIGREVIGDNGVAERLRRQAADLQHIAKGVTPIQQQGVLLHPVSRLAGAGQEVATAQKLGVERGLNRLGARIAGQVAGGVGCVAHHKLQAVARGLGGVNGRLAARTGQHTQALHLVGCFIERQGLVTLLEVEAAAERQEVAHLGADLTLHPQQLALGAVHLKRELGVRAGAHCIPQRVGFGLAVQRVKIDHRWGCAHAGLQVVHLIDLHAKFGGRQAQGGQAHQLDRIGLHRQRQPAHAIQTHFVGIELAALGIEQAQAQAGIAQRKAHRFGVDQIAVVDHAIGIAVNAVSTAHAGKGLHIGCAHGQGIDRHLRAVGQGHAVAALFKSRRAIEVNIVAQLEGDASADAEHLVVGAVHAEQTRALRPGQHREVGVGKVDDAAGGLIGQVDAHPHIAHRHRDIGHTHQTRRGGLGFERHAGGLRC